MPVCCVHKCELYFVKTCNYQFQLIMKINHVQVPRVALFKVHQTAFYFFKQNVSVQKVRLTRRALPPSDVSSNGCGTQTHAPVPPQRGASPFDTNRPTLRTSLGYNGPLYISSFYPQLFSLFLWKPGSVSRLSYSNI